jgi:hypothetical protein
MHRALDRSRATISGKRKYKRFQTNSVDAPNVNTMDLRPRGPMFQIITTTSDQSLFGMRRAMTRICIAALTALLLGCGSALAQTTPGLSPLGMTSPLGVGPGAPVPPAGIPLGAIQMQSLGVSPLTSGVSPVSPTTGTNSTCGGIGGSIPEASFGVASSATGTSAGMGSAMSGTMSGTSYGTGTSTAGTSVSTSTFDGAGMAGTTSGTCPVPAGSSLGSPASSASSPSGMGSVAVGRLGVPLGSTELGVGGLSPIPTTPTLNSAAPSSTLSTVPCPSAGTASTAGTSSSTGMTTTTGSC